MGPPAPRTGVRVSVPPGQPVGGYGVYSRDTDSYKSENSRWAAAAGKGLPVRANLALQEMQVMFSVQREKEGGRTGKNASVPSLEIHPVKHFAGSR